MTFTVPGEKRRSWWIFDIKNRAVCWKNQYVRNTPIAMCTVRHGNPTKQQWRCCPHTHTHMDTPASNSGGFTNYWLVFPANKKMLPTKHDALKHPTVGISATNSMGKEYEWVLVNLRKMEQLHWQTLPWIMVRIEIGGFCGKSSTMRGCCLQPAGSLAWRLLNPEIGWMNLRWLLTSQIYARFNQRLGWFPRRNTVVSPTSTIGRNSKAATTESTSE